MPYREISTPESQLILNQLDPYDGLDKNTIYEGVKEDFESLVSRPWLNTVVLSGGIAWGKSELASMYLFYLIKKLLNSTVRSTSEKFIVIIYGEPVYNYLISKLSKLDIEIKITNDKAELPKNIELRKMKTNELIFGFSNFIVVVDETHSHKDAFCSEIQNISLNNSNPLIKCIFITNKLVTQVENSLMSLAKLSCSSSSVFASNRNHWERDLRFENQTVGSKICLAYRAANTFLPPAVYLVTDMTARKQSILTALGYTLMPVSNEILDRYDNDLVNVLKSGAGIYLASRTENIIQGIIQ